MISTTSLYHKVATPLPCGSLNGLPSTGMGPVGYFIWETDIQVISHGVIIKYPASVRPSVRPCVHASVHPNFAEAISLQPLHRFTPTQV